MPLLICYHAGAKGVRLFQKHCFFQEQILSIRSMRIQDKVHTASDGFCHCKRRSAEECAEIVSVKQIFADL